MRTNRIGSVLIVLAFVFTASTMTLAQTEKTPSQTYMEYYAAATLMLEGVDKSKTKTSVTVTMVREAGAWKIEKEDQKTGK